MASSNALLADDEYALARVDETTDAFSPLRSSPRFVGDRPVVHRIETGLVPGLVIETSIPPVPGLVEAISRLHELKALSPNWDSNGALQVSREVYRPALDLITHSLVRCRQPRITANGDGGVVLLWEEGARELEIEVRPNGGLTIFEVIESGEEFETERTFSVGEAREVLSKFCRDL